MKTIDAILIGLFVALTAKCFGIPSYSTIWWIYIILVNIILDSIFIFPKKDK